MNFLGKIYYRFFSRLIECATIWRVDLSELSLDIKVEVPENFEFVMPGIDDIESLRDLYNNEYRVKLAQERFESGNYLCFAYKDKTTSKLAYTRWLCKHRFYSDALKKELVLSDNEAITLDSWTGLAYRNLGLHKNMNVEMLLWLKQNTNIQHVLIIIKCFNPHLTKVVRSIGYKRIKTFIIKKTRE